MIQINGKVDLPDSVSVTATKKSQIKRYKVKLLHEKRFCLATFCNKSQLNRYHQLIACLLEHQCLFEEKSTVAV